MKSPQEDPLKKVHIECIWLAHNNSWNDKTTIKY